MTRVVVDPDGSRWRERDKGGGVVERRLIDGGSTIYRATAEPVRMIEPEKRRERPLEEELAIRARRMEELNGARFEVSFSDRTRDRMHDVIRSAAPYRVETGGLLYSLHQPTWRAVSVCYATPPGPNSRHSLDSVHLSSLAAIEREMPDFLSHLAWVRDWHTHFGRHEPSRADRQSWVDCLRRSRMPYFVGLICTRDDEGHGWMFPFGHAYVTFKEGGRTVCERVPIVDR